MSKPAAFKANYADWKLVKTRACVQIIFEIPVEKANEAYEVLGGMPFSATESWFAIARLKQQQEEPTTATEKPAPVSPPVRVPRKWNELSMPQQAGIMGETEAFRKFMCEKYGYTHADCPLMIRQECKVESRKELLPGTLPGTTWLRIVADYRAWMHEPEYV